MGSAQVSIREEEKKGASDLRAHAHSLAGLSRIPRPSYGSPKARWRTARSPEAAELLGDLPLLAALRASSLARLRRAMEFVPPAR